jgi:hypothetical protein
MSIPDVPLQIVLPCEAAFCAINGIAAAIMLAVESPPSMHSLMSNEVFSQRECFVSTRA